MTTITRIHAREVLDSRGRPTVEVDLFCDGGVMGRATVPAGASTGTTEAADLRDGDPDRFDGHGVLRAVANVNERIAPELIGCDASDQNDIDGRLIELDGTPQKTKLGGNALLGVSLANACATASAMRSPLHTYISWLAATTDDPDEQTLDPIKAKMPLPMVNMISGGLHAGKNLDFQDFLIIPRGASSYRLGLDWVTRVYWRLGEVLRKAGYEGWLVGDEGGYGPRLKSNREAAELLMRAIEDSELRPGEDIQLAVDVAATHFFDTPSYYLKSGGNATLGSSEMVDLIESLCNDFPIAVVEDPLAEDDWQGWSELTQRIGSRVGVMGDDLLTTSRERVEKAIQQRAANAVLIKPNQVGTLTEALETQRVARDAGFVCTVSARSGETEDTFIADMAVGTAADYIKIGSIVRGERTAKYNRLLRIAEELGR